ncbi:AbiJ-NTD4 domain-containing protein [Priestia megaterium]|uniref:AbiJ-NTD4 domain-containing protein n=1 Tax=Priestia megaterium TaxID=1404 RepID=UPI003242AF5B
MRDFFSEREQGKKELKSETISIAVYNGIVGIFEKYTKNFALEFPIRCSDNDAICGTNIHFLNTSIKSYIPGIQTPVQLKNDRYFGDDDTLVENEKYDLLDFIEYCHSKIVDVVEDENNYHGWFQHYHLIFPKTEVAKENFRAEVNRIFQRNGIVFYLDTDGMIKRHLPSDMNNLIQNLIVHSPDEKLNELVNTAIDYIRKPQIESRNIALEKIWDAFERIKTFYVPANKKVSAAQLIQNVSGQTDGFDNMLEIEFKALTDIGNNYQIRHFETNRIEIQSMKQVDYLFYRMIALIDLCMSDINVATSV